MDGVHRGWLTDKQSRSNSEPPANIVALKNLTRELVASASGSGLWLTFGSKPIGLTGLVFGPGQTRKVNQCMANPVPMEFANQIYWPKLQRIRQ